MLDLQATEGFAVTRDHDSLSYAFGHKQLHPVSSHNPSSISVRSMTPGTLHCPSGSWNCADAPEAAKNGHVEMILVLSGPPKGPRPSITCNLGRRCEEADFVLEVDQSGTREARVCFCESLSRTVYLQEVFWPSLQRSNPTQVPLSDKDGVQLGEGGLLLMRAGHASIRFTAFPKGP